MADDTNDHADENPAKLSWYQRNREKVLARNKAKREGPERAAMLAAANEWRAKNAERLRAEAREQHAKAKADPEKRAQLKAERRDWYERNKERILAENKAKRRGPEAEQIRAYHRELRQRDPEKFRARDRERYADQSTGRGEKARAYGRAYRKANADVVRAVDRQRWVFRREHHNTRRNAARAAERFERLKQQGIDPLVWSQMSRQERAVASTMQWRRKNKERIHAYNRKRLATNVQARLAITVRSRLTSAVRYLISRDPSTPRRQVSGVRDLGCTIDEFKAYIESKFQTGMTWENWGLHGPNVWHLDHVRPMASFDLTDRAQALQAVHYTNMQPIWSTENHRKSARWDGKDWRKLKGLTMSEQSPVSWVPSKLDPFTSLNPLTFRKMIARRGSGVLWEKAVQCPCSVMAALVAGDTPEATGESREVCEECIGKGFIFHDGQLIQANVVNASKNILFYQLYGAHAKGMASITTHPEHMLKQWDRITVIESIMPMAEPGERFDGEKQRLRYPVAEVTLSTSADGDTTVLEETTSNGTYFRCADANGVLVPTVLVEGTHYSIDDDGLVVWASPTFPAVGARVSFEYWCHPSYIVNDTPHVHRDTRLSPKVAKKVGGRRWQRLPTNVHVWLEHFGPPHGYASPDPEAVGP